MNGPGTSELSASPVRRACLVDGCTCKDARIVSNRRASFFANIAKARGETADRVVPADDEWRLPISPALDAVRALAAVEASA